MTVLTFLRRLAFLCAAACLGTLGCQPRLAACLRQSDCDSGLVCRDGSCEAPDSHAEDTTGGTHEAETTGVPGTPPGSTTTTGEDESSTGAAEDDSTSTTTSTTSTSSSSGSTSDDGTTPDASDGSSTDTGSSEESSSTGETTSG